MTRNCSAETQRSWDTCAIPWPVFTRRLRSHVLDSAGAVADVAEPIHVIAVTVDGVAAEIRAEYRINGKVFMVVTGWYVETVTAKIKQMLENIGYDYGEVIYETSEREQLNRN